MIVNNNTLTLTLLLLILCSAGGHAKQLSTCLDYSPYSLDAEGNKVWGGTNIETLFTVTERLNYSLDASIRAPFVRCLKLLKKGEVDILSGLIHTKERAKDFVLVPYKIKNRLAVFYLKGNSKTFSLDNPTDGLIIGQHRAFAIPEDISSSKLMNTLVSVHSVRTGLKMVQAQRIDGVLATIDTGEIELKYEPFIRNQFTYQALPSSGDQMVYFAISRRSPLAKNIDDLAVVISKLSEDSKYQHLNLFVDRAN